MGVRFLADPLDDWHVMLLGLRLLPRI